MRRPLAVLAALGPFAAEAAAKQSVSARPDPVGFGDTLIVRGKGWPVIEFCSRTVRISLRSDQNAFRIGTVRVKLNGRFRFEWIPRRAQVGAGTWTLVARMRCESGDDGSPVPVRASTTVHIGRFNFLVGRGANEKGRWLLYSRRGRLGGFCTGLGTRALRPGSHGGSGEGCGGGLGGKALTMGLTYSRHRGTYAYGMAATPVVAVRVRFGDHPEQEARLLASPPALGFDGRFWVAWFPTFCQALSVEAFGAGGTSLGAIALPPGAYPRSECPKAKKVA